MPLTFLSHQAVVLPLKIGAPRWTSGTALVIGSMAPDVEYYARTYPGAGPLSHTWLGQLTFCLPVSLVLYWLVTRIIARPLAAHLPDGGALHLRDYALLSEQPSGAAHLPVVALSALVGSSSHVVLDRLSGGWSMHNAAEYGAWFPFSAMSADWHWIAFKLATWIVLATVTLLMMRYMGERRLLRRWNAERVAAQEVSATVAADFPASRAPVHREPLRFWGTIIASGMLGGVLGSIFRRSGFLMHHPATWVHIGLATLSASFLGLVLASVLWRYRASRSLTLRETNQ